jgi:hypothetical protein
LLLALLLFNWFGYRVLTSFLEERASNRLEISVSNNDYDESRLISIKIPVSYLLYYSIPKIFERVDGQVEIQGVEYRYVKRRIHNDSLELLCISNPALMKLKAASIEIFRFVNDLYHEGSDKSDNSHHGSSKSFSPDKYTLITTNSLDKPGFPLPAIHSHYLPGISSHHPTVDEQPPEIA